MPLCTGQSRCAQLACLWTVQTCRVLQVFWIEMRSPTTKDFGELKRVGRYMRGRPVGAIMFKWQTVPGVLEVFCDADLAGNLKTRIWRSGMVKDVRACV